MVFVCFCLLRCFRRSKPNQSFWALPLANFLMTTKGLWAVITLDETGIWPVSPRPWNCLIFDRKIWFLERPGDDWWTLCCDKPDSTSQVVISTTHIIDASFSLMARLFAVQYVWSQIRLARTAVRIAACIFQKVESLCLILFSAFRDDLCWWSVISVFFPWTPKSEKNKRPITGSGKSFKMVSCSLFACQDLLALQGFSLERLQLGNMSYKELNKLAGDSAYARTICKI